MFRSTASLSTVPILRHCALVSLPYYPTGYLPFAPWSHCPILHPFNYPPHFIIGAHHIVVFAGQYVLHPDSLSYPQDPTLRTTIGLGALKAAIAQLGERQTEDLKVPGSIPGLGVRPSPACAE